MGCTFCATGQAGLRAPPRRRRDRRAGRARRRTRRPSGSATSCSWAWASRSPTTTRRGRAVERLHDDFGISARRITVSTVGVVPGIRRLAAEALPVTLAVSLHAPDDAAARPARAAQPPLPDRRGARRRRRLRRRHGRRVTFEYACIAGVNDRLDQAEALGTPAPGVPGRGGAHVNLIPLNPTAGFAGHAPRHDRRCGSFAERLRGPRRDRDGPPQPGHRHRRGVRAAPRPGRDPRRPSAIGNNGPVNQSEVGQSVPAPDPRHRHVPLLHRRRLRAAVRRRGHVGARAARDHRPARRRRLRHRQREALGLRRRGRSARSCRS